MDTIVYANGAQEIVITVREVLLLIGGPIVFLILHKMAKVLWNLEAKANKNGH